MAEKLLKDVVKKCLHLGCAEAEASMQSGCSVRVGIEREFEMVDSINHNHIAARVLLNGKIGLSSMFLTDVSADTISKLAVNSANANPFRDELSSISPSKSLPHEGEKLKHLRSSYEEIINWVKSEVTKINNVFSCRVLSLIFGYESQVVTLCNSHGASGHYLLTVSYIAGSAQTNTAVHSRPIFFICHGIIPGDDIPTILSNQRFIDRLRCSDATSIEELRGRVKFTPLATTQVVSSLAQAFCGNYIVNGKSFIRKSDIGTRVLDECLSLFDDPIIAGGKVYIPFDAEGVLANRKHLIREGRIEDFLCDIFTKNSIGSGKAGNAHHVFPDHENKITPSNLVLIIERPCNDDCNAIIEDMGVQNTINIETGELKGFASGYKINSTGKIPTLFSLNINIMHLFKTVEAASISSWIGPVFAPSIISTIN